MMRFLLTVACVTLAGVRGQAADALYHNVGTVFCDSAPQIDATVFVNDGSFCALPITGSLIGANSGLPLGGIPYMTQDTLWFTNNNLMQSGPGFWLDYVGADGLHRPAAAIVNSAGGANGPSRIFGTEFMLLSASNLVNKGILEISSAGLMQLSGGNVDLAYGGLLVDAASGGGACVPDNQFRFYIDSTNFFPISGLVADLYWGEGALMNMASSQIALQRGSSIVVQSPFHTVTNLNFPVGTGTRVGPISNPQTFVRTNALTPTNWNVQVVFVGSSAGSLDTNILTDVKFVNNNYPENQPPNNGFQTAILELKSIAEDIVTGNPITYALYVVDQLATQTNLNSLTNVANGVTQRPAAYIVDIYPPCSFFEAGNAPNTTFNGKLIYDPDSYASNVVAATFAGYGAFLATATAGATLPTNSPGRIDITASNLDLTHARIRGESIVTVKTPHLVGSSGLVVDAANINYSIGSTNGLLSVSGNDLANPQVLRFGGLLTMWSGLWTNFASVVVTNIGPDPNDPTMTVTNLATNQVEVDIHTLIVDAAGLSTVAPVFLNEFSANSTNIVLNDAFDVSGAFSLKGDSVTVGGPLTLETSDWRSTNVNVKTLTNNGAIIVADIMEMGDARQPYSSVVNNTGASILAFTVLVDADYFEDAGTISAGGPMTVKARTGKLEGGKLVAGNDMSIFAQDLKLSGHQQSSAAFYLTVTNSLYDSGAGASNRLICNNGFVMRIKPKSGDLFGTTLQTQAAQFRQADHLWSAEDRGASPAGYSNNVVIGRLVVSATTSSLLTFSGTGANNALYVDRLDLSGAALTDLQSVLSINTNLVIYFADANVPADTLDGQFADSLQPAGRLRWVSGFAGPNSSVAVLLPDGQTTNMNRALRFSTKLDTDGDGVPNAYDCYPLDPTAWNCAPSALVAGATASVNNELASRSVSVTWAGLPSGLYQVEFTTDLSQPDWRPLMNYTNIAVSEGALTILDASVLTGESQRFYRLRYGR